jgi:hypothetical protein
MGFILCLSLAGDIHKQGKKIQITLILAANSIALLEWVILTIHSNTTKWNYSEPESLSMMLQIHLVALFNRSILANSFGE